MSNAELPPSVALERLDEIAREMRDRKVNHGKAHSPTLIAWANRITDELATLRASLTHPAAVDEDAIDRAYDTYETTVNGYYVFNGEEDNRGEAMRAAITAALLPATSEGDKA